ncbi:cytochrome P450 [Streptomyces tauricus]
MVPPIPFLPVAGPRGLPFLGNLPAFGRGPLAFLEHLRDDFGDVVTWPLGPARIISLAHPEHIAELLGAHERDYATPDIGWAFGRLVGRSVIRSQGADWRRKRSLVQPAVRPRQVSMYAATMVECAAALADRWQDGTRIDVLREMTLLTQRIVVRTLFGNDIGDQARALAEAMTVAGREIGTELRGIGLCLPPWVRTPARRRLLEAVSVVDTEMGRLIDARVIDARATRTQDDGREDALSRLLAARDEAGRPLTRTEVRDEAVTLWVGGHETTSTALTWSWYLLSTSPNARMRLAAEIERVLAGRLPTIDDYERLTWTQQIVRETLRLYPPGWMIPPRVAQKGAVLAGTPIPAGTMVWCSQWVTHRDPRWFRDPTSFRPERWDADGGEAAPQHAWFPFGGGRRACLGARFALVETALVLATLAQRFQLDVAEGDITPLAGLQLQPATPLHATVRAMSLRPGG